MAGIGVNSYFQYNAPVPSDSRFVLSKAEFLVTNDNVMPEKYFAICKDDGKFYLYNKANSSDVKLGKWRLLEGGTSENIETWQPSTEYVIGAKVKHPVSGQVIKSISTHTSGTTFDDTEAGLWYYVFKEYYFVTKEQYDKLVSDGIITDDTKDLFIVKDGNTDEESTNIKSISVNGSNIEPDDNKNVNITVPAKVSELTNDETYIKSTQIATNDQLGLVKPDGTTITVADGVLTANQSNCIDDDNISEEKCYSSSKANTIFAKIADVLTLTNAVVFTPTGDYQPATKKYVDDAITALNGIMTLKTRVDSVDKLPSDATAGDVYYVGLANADSFDTYAKLGDGNWLKIGSTTMNLDDYYKKTETEDLLKTKITICDTLPSSVSHIGQCYFNASDGCIYQGGENGIGGYTWKKITNNESPIHVSTSQPSDKSKMWIDTSNSDNYLIKIYDTTKQKWKILNPVSTITKETVQAQIDTSIDKVVDAAPADLSTLKKIATAIDNDATFSATLSDKINKKQNKIYVSDSEPTSPEEEDMWICVTGDNLYSIKLYKEGKWVNVTSPVSEVTSGLTIDTYEW